MDVVNWRKNKILIIIVELIWSKVFAALLPTIVRSQLGNVHTNGANSITAIVRAI